MPKQHEYLVVPDENALMLSGQELIVEVSMAKHERLGMDVKPVAVPRMMYIANPICRLGTEPGNHGPKVNCCAHDQRSIMSLRIG